MMGYPLNYLLENSRLPGPRANLELLYEFIKNASEQEIAECLSVEYKHSDSPEEFVLTCGVAAAIYHSAKEKGTVVFKYREYANHESWRVREGVCIGFQKSKGYLKPSQMICDLQPLKDGTTLEVRTYIATLSEPCLLVDYIDANWLLSEMYRITIKHFNHNGKLSDDDKVLRKALAYCWSVALCGQSAERTMFESLVEQLEFKHIKWIIEENLKKKRLEKLDSEWLDGLKTLVI